MHFLGVAVVAAICHVVVEGVEAANGGPVGQVVSLITEMKAQVETDAEEDLKAYEKYMCWCTTNEKEKVAAIAFAEQEIARLTTFLEVSAAKETELKTQIQGLTDDIAEANDALASATALRKEENEDFTADEADMKETRTLLEQAIGFLSKVQLVQEKGSSSEVVSSAAGSAMEALVQIRSKATKGGSPKYSSVVQRDLYDMLGSLQEMMQSGGSVSSLPPSEVRSPKRGAANLMQRRLLPWEKTDEQTGQEAKANDLMGAAAGAKSYNARSGRILGILSEMHDEFSRDLGQAQYTEYMALVSFQKLKAAKLSEIHIATETKERKEADLAELLNAMAQAKEDREEMTEAKEADEKFLAMLRESCKEEDSEYHSRLEVRTEELRALSETLKILADDEARATFSKTVSFFQETSKQSQRVAMAERTASQDRVSERAMQRIAEVARKHQNLAMVSLAMHVRLDSFTKVIAAMDKMLAELKTQQKDEYEKREFCNKEIDETEDLVKVHTITKKKLDKTHLALTDELQTLNGDVATLKTEVAEMEVSLKQASEERKAESEIYQQSVMDQRAAINILNKALARLKAFYATKSAFLQQQPGALPPPPPPKGKAYEKSGGASGVLQLIIKIVEDAESEEKSLDVTENNAQRRYAAFVNDATASIEADRAAIQEKEKLIATKEAAKAEVEEEQLANDTELDRLDKLLKAHHLDCDFLLKYFDLRQKFRGEEIDSITDAKAILSGADFGK